jgi:outer membrane protein assembly factor BamB
LASQNGNLYCLNALTGGNIWTKKISDYVFAIDPAPYPVVASNTSIMSRTSPAVSGTTLVRRPARLLWLSRCAVQLAGSVLLLFEQPRVGIPT